MDWQSVQQLSVVGVRSVRALGSGLRGTHVLHGSTPYTAPSQASRPSHFLGYDHV